MEEHVHGVQRMCIHGARLRNPDNHLLLSLAIHVMINAGDRGVGKKKLTTSQRNQVNTNGMTVHFGWYMSLESPKEKDVSKEGVFLYPDSHAHVDASEIRRWHQSSWAL